MQGASVKQTRSVCSERARTPAGGRSRRGFAKQICGFSAQTISPIWMRCYRISAGHAPHQRNPKPAENRTLCRARALGKRRGNAGWDALSQRRSKRKVHPGIYAQNGIHFPDAYSSGNCIPESTLEMGFIFQMNGRRKVHPGICPESGTRFPNGSSCSLGRGPAQPPRPLNSKTCAPSIPKLGRRKPKRNRRRSI